GDTFQGIEKPGVQRGVAHLPRGCVPGSTVGFLGTLVPVEDPAGAMPGPLRFHPCVPGAVCGKY
ncbi:MAG: hypothetical protein M3P51_16420, partial [Chloroflexota bacterium]|nr:hypothetical protein [Chloroflexota bacterium]